MRVEQQNYRLIIHDGRSECWIDPWGKDSLRVRMSAEPGMDGHDWALTEPVEATDVVIRSEVIDTTDPWYKGDEWAKYHQTGTEWTLTNGKITAKISTEGWITFLNQRGEVLTAEYWRNRDRINRYCVPLRVPARELKPIPGGTDFSLTARFEAYDDEMIFGMGQYQDRHLNKKGSVLELAHRNSQSSVPFFVSSRGYGFLWNNPAIGTAAFGTNVTEWSAKSTKKAGLFHHGGRHPGGHRSELHRRNRAHPYDARIRHGLLAVQAALPDAGGTAVCRTRNEAPRAAAGRHRRRLLPLDAAR